jgi:hypothetical protein
VTIHTLQIKHVQCKKINLSWAWWFMPVISTLSEAKIGRIKVQSQLGQKNISETPSEQTSLAWWVIVVIPAMREV